LAVEMLRCRGVGSVSQPKYLPSARPSFHINKPSTIAPHPRIAIRYCAAAAEATTPAAAVPRGRIEYPFSFFRNLRNWTAEQELDYLNFAPTRFSREEGDFHATLADQVVPPYNEQTQLVLDSSVDKQMISGFIALKDEHTTFNPTNNEAGYHFINALAQLQATEAKEPPRKDEGLTDEVATRIIELLAINYNSGITRSWPQLLAVPIGPASIRGVCANAIADNKNSRVIVPFTEVRPDAKDEQDDDGLSRMKAECLGICFSNDNATPAAEKNGQRVVLG